MTLKPYSSLRYVRPTVEQPQTILGQIASWLGIATAISGLVLTFFWLIGFHYSRQYLVRFGLLDSIERPLVYTASVGAEQALAFLTANWAFIVPALLGLIIFTIAAARIDKRWLGAGKSDKYFPLLLILLYSFLVFGLIPIEMGRRQAIIQTDRIIERLERCLENRGGCVTYWIEGNPISGARIVSDRDRFFIVTGEGIRVVPIEELDRITFGPHLTPVDSARPDRERPPPPEPQAKSAANPR